MSSSGATWFATGRFPATCPTTNAARSGQSISRIPRAGRSRPRPSPSDSARRMRRSKGSPNTTKPSSGSMRAYSTSPSWSASLGLVLASRPREDEAQPDLHRRISGMERFCGLGDLMPKELASLFDKRHEVTAAEKELARKAHAALRSPIRSPSKKSAMTTRPRSRILTVR